MLLIAAAVTMPVAAAAVVAAPGVASAAPKVVPSITCTVSSGSVNFASPGLSTNGTVGLASANKTTTTTADANLTGAGCASALDVSITTKTDKCAKSGTQPVPECVKGDVYWDTASSFITGGTSDIATALKKGINTTDGSTAITLEVTSGGTSEVTPSDPQCGGETGFLLTGAVKKFDDTYTELTCLGTDSGSDVSGVFLTDLVAAEEGGSPVISGVAIDPVYSQLTITEG
ncbi:MAG: hypothetical protein ABSB09_15390 [Acidimicrobiales bacterium]|jgi:hypothetical protein